MTDFSRFCHGEYFDNFRPFAKDVRFRATAENFSLRVRISLRNEYRYDYRNSRPAGASRLRGI
jgi:hypothetical protein